MISKPYGARIASPPRSIPPSLRDTKGNPLGMSICCEHETHSSVLTGIRGSLAVMTVTLPCDDGYRTPYRREHTLGL